MDAAELSRLTGLPVDQAADLLANLPAPDLVRLPEADAHAILTGYVEGLAAP